MSNGCKLRMLLMCLRNTKAALKMKQSILHGDIVVQERSCDPALQAYKLPKVKGKRCTKNIALALAITKLVCRGVSAAAPTSEIKTQVERIRSRGILSGGSVHSSARRPLARLFHRSDGQRKHREIFQLNAVVPRLFRLPTCFCSSPFLSSIQVLSQNCVELASGLLATNEVPVKVLGL